MLEQQLNMLDFGEISSVIDKTYPSGGISFKELVEKAVTGKLDLSFNSILDYASKLFFSEITDNLAVIRNLLIIAILAALLKNLSESFKNKSVGELGFYAGYIMIILILFSSFQIACGIASDMVGQLSSLIGASVPLVTTLTVMSGNVSAAYVLNPTLLFLANIVTVVIKDFILPGIIMAASVSIVNYLNGKEILTKLTELFKNSLSFCLKAMAGLFMGIISLQRISAPLMGNVMGKTAKSAISLVPVVGEALSSSVDTYLYFTHAAKSGVVVAVFIVTAAMFAMPVIKLAALIFIYKLTAGIVQPICDERVVKCIDSVGGYTVLLLGAVVTVATMFLFALMIVLSL